MLAVDSIFVNEVVAVNAVYIVYKSEKLNCD
jgi:hypothetical protein